MVSPILQDKTDDNSHYFLSCDWGTSSFRLNLVNAKTGNMRGTISNDLGTKKIYDRWLSVEEPKDRIEYYRSFLKQQINTLTQKLAQNIDRLPLLISGMASSSIGIQELPYSSLPFALDQPNLHIETFKATDQFPHTIYLISGLRSKSDVMRGEETELLGLFSSTGITNGLYIMAGTHSKQVVVKNNIVTDFKTYMTGELFDLLSSKSILSNSLTKQQKDGPGSAFKKGIASSLKENILQELFKIRANDILNQSDPIENYDYLSGLLIGTELKDIRHQNEENIVLTGKPRLQKYYATALNILGLNYIQPDSSSQNIIILGHSIISNQLKTQL